PVLPFIKPLLKYSFTNCNLEKLIVAGKFREDLFYRLGVIKIICPSLRERVDDIPLLVAHFFKKRQEPMPEFASDVWNTLKNFPWPGNIRQLENVIDSALVLAGEPGKINVKDLPPEILATCKTVAFQDDDGYKPGVGLEEIEKNTILKALENTHWNQTRAAKELNITRQTLIYRIKKYGISKS
ncbi:helix-turn-helix domain-containing protein, partial [Candidatus Riflebacteria bacterium]